MPISKMKLMTRVRFASALMMSAMLAAHANAQDAQAAPVTTWPLRVDSPAGSLTIYEPQPEKFEGDTLNARAAVSLTPAGATNPEFGALWMQARVVTDRDARTVAIQNITVKRVKLPNATADQEQQFGQVVQQQLPGLNVVLSLDQLESTLGVVQKAREESKQLQNTPPKIIFTTNPSTLVVLDGPPKLQPAEVAGVMRVINTPFIMLLDLQSKQYFLKAGDVWQTATDVIGPWSPTNAVPSNITDEGTKLEGQQPQPADNTAQPAPAGLTQIIVSEEPAELICSDGAPTYTPLPGNDLLYMSNTQADIFMEVASQQYFVLLSGRWFAGPALQGPWAYVAADKLPAAFAAIPPDSAKGNVLVSVAGTQEAKDAKLDAFIPQTTAIDRNSGTNLTVSYDGDPQFTPVAGTPISYAANCADPLLFVNNGYFCCHQAVWYQSNSAAGPWAVCTSVPSVIYTLPPSCPVYYCRYVYVYDSTPDTVYCGYLPGYTGCYVYGGTVVYGTGYRYPYWYGHRFIPHPYTWGFGARYDYYSGTWGLGASISFGPRWIAADHQRHNWFGPGGFVDYHEIRQRHEGPGYNVHDEHIVRNVNRNVTINRIDIYRRQENVKRNIVVKNQLHTNVTRNGHEPVRGGNTAKQRPTPPAQNNVYAGHDGQIYRRTDKGWETNTNKGWTAFKGVPEAPAKVAPREVPVKQTPRETPVRETPVRETPVRETPQKAPARDQTPTRTEQPRRVEQPARNEQPSDGGLEQEHIARERGSQRGGGGGNANNAGGGGGEQRGGGNSNRGNNNGGGNNGGGNNGNNNNGGGNNNGGRRR